MSWRFWLACLAAGAPASQAFALQTISTFCAAYPDQCQKGTESLMAIRGTGTNAYYVLEADPTTGALPVNLVAPTQVDVHIDGHVYADSVRNAYASVNVTTGAWVQLIAATAAECNTLTLFDSSGQTLEIGTGAAGFESRKLIVPPGGVDGMVPILIPAGTRVAIRAVSATASSGELDITLLN